MRWDIYYIDDVVTNNNLIFYFGWTEVHSNILTLYYSFDILMFYYGKDNLYVSSKIYNLNGYVTRYKL